MSTPAEYPTATEADWERRVRTQAIVDRVAVECERVGLDDPSLRSIQITVKLNPGTGAVRSVVVSRETEG